MREWLNLWYSFYEDPGFPPFTDPYDLAGVLADLRRDPRLLARAFDPLPHGDEVLGRVRRCVSAEHDHSGIYLVADPIEATDDEIRSLVTNALELGSQCCGLDIPKYTINVVRRVMSRSESYRSAPLVEELGDLYIEYAHDDRGPEGQAMQFLLETLYTLAASFEVQGYCLTPLCPAEVRRIDPYSPQIELWLRGVHPVLRWNDGCHEPWVDAFVR